MTRQRPDGRDMARRGARADVVIVGAGPVGLALALDLADRGLHVCMIEAGPEPPVDADIVDPARHAPMALATRRGFGGTSLLWGGRCLSFDAVDFAERPHVPMARWPIGLGDVAPYEASAAAFLDCGPPGFQEPWPEEVRADGLSLDALERWCARPNLSKVHGARISAHANIDLRLRTVVTHVEVDPVTGAAVRLRLRRDGLDEVLPVRSVVLAGGGLETTRLLLASRRDQPALFGGEDGPLGRYYMGHIFGSIADIVFTRPGADLEFQFRRGTDGRYLRRRMVLDTETQLALGLLNAAAWPDPPPIADARHGSAILSLAALALAAPVLGPRLSTEASRRRKLGPDPLRPWPHLGNVARDLPGAIRFATGFLTARYLESVRMPGFFVPNPARRYDFHVHAEHAPDPASRVTLTSDIDRHGMPRLAVDLRFNEIDARSVVETVDAMAERLAAAGLARIEHRHPPEERVAAMLAQASDGFHQIGTARMSDDARSGVVDGEGRVHGTSNLYVAGSAVFPSSGQANPTFLAVALAFRLADRLSEDMRVLPAVSAAE